MKLTQNNDKFNLELTRYELDILFLISEHIGGIGEMRTVFSSNKKEYQGLNDCYLSELTPPKILKEIYVEGFMLNGDLHYVPTNDNLNPVKRDKFGRFSKK